MHLYNSRFLMAIFGALVPVVAGLLGVELTTEEIAAIEGVIAAFVLGESYRKSKVQ